MEVFILDLNIKQNNRINKSNSMKTNKKNPKNNTITDPLKNQ